LGQPVALKFLPESMIDKSMLERFHNEVRIARRISHPNVCRVYDIGETDNQVFLSMEYVDGEDLSSLLRRIGRLPVDQALAIARKICAGLAAAHDKGVLHRDLKPSNIMIDARGEVLIMDFGLAGLAHEIEDVRSGTPAYMAPEQLVGKEVTARSDIYALGLVFYELFTGKPAFEGNTQDEIMRVRRESTPHRLSTLVRDLGPAVEMVILRCLEEEPENRPSSALIVSAALPGGEYLLAIYRPTTTTLRSKPKRCTARSTCSMTKWWLPVPRFLLAVFPRPVTRGRCGPSPMARCSSATGRTRRPRNT